VPAFFIDRPVFASVIALLICLGGLLAIPFVPVAQYPIIAPPSISISTAYPGASPQDLYNSVTRLIEGELNGANREGENGGAFQVLPDQYHLRHPL
jgi:multidrug efflux pump